jgi:hypothetical protein
MRLAIAICNGDRGQPRHLPSNRQDAPQSFFAQRSRIAGRGQPRNFGRSTTEGSKGSAATWLDGGTARRERDSLGELTSRFSFQNHCR